MRKLRKLNQKSMAFLSPRFTLIEVLFAITISGVGVMSLLGLLYSVFDSGQDALDETRIPQLSAQFSTYVTSRIRQDWAGYVNTAAGTFTLPVYTGGTFNKDNLDDAVEDPNWQVEGDPRIFSHNTRAGLYKVVTEDFAVSIRVWQEAVTTALLANDGNQFSMAIDDGQAIVLHMEMSAPFSKGYAGRQRWRFQYTVLNPNGTGEYTPL